MIRLTIDGRTIEAHKGTSVLEAALAAGIQIPHLCWHPDLPSVGVCRLCVVEIEGRRGLPPACTTEVAEGMVVRTNTPRLQQHRKNIMWLLESEYQGDVPEGSELARIRAQVGTASYPVVDPQRTDRPRYDEDPLIVRDLNKCILCTRCIRACQDLRGCGVLGLANRGIRTVVATAYERSLADSGCRFCTACVEVCPSGAFTDAPPRPIPASRVRRYPEPSPKEEVVVPCQVACPAGIDVPLYVRLIAEGRYHEALAVIREKVPFPHVLGCVCPHPCETACRRAALNDPVAIRALKKFVGALDDGRWMERLRIRPDTGKKVGIVGSGPAGLTAAWFLRLAGHEVHVFEALPKPGGMLRYAIPRYRLPEEVVEKEIRFIEKIGVIIHTDTGQVTGGMLHQQGFDAVFLAMGANRGAKMGVEGEDDPRVLDGLTFLRSHHLGQAPELGGRLLVVGGGNVAVDVARTALRLGTKSVTILYRRSRAEMPAFPEEVEACLEEGVRIEFLTTPIRIEPTASCLRVTCTRMELTEPDASGRRRPVPIPGSEFELEADSLVMAIGQKASFPERCMAPKTPKGWLLVDKERLQTPMPGFFGGGDIVTGPSTVIEAIQTGRVAAMAIDEYLGGSGEIDQALYERQEPPRYLGRDPHFAGRQRVRPRLLPVDERLSGCGEVELVYSPEEASREADRCLRCGIRLDIRAPDSFGGND